LKRCIFAFLFCIFSSAFAWGGTDTLVVEGDWAFPPFEFVGNNGEPEGMNVDLVRDIMRRQHKSYVIRLKRWHDVLKDFEQGKVDLIMGMNFSNERTKKYKFGTVHGYIYQDVVFQSDNHPIHDMRQLDGKRVILEKGAYASELLKEHKSKIRAYYTTDMNDGLKLLSEGKYDAAICDHDMAVEMIKRGNFNNLHAHDLGLPPQEYRFVSNDDKLLDDLDVTLYEMKKDGTFESISNQWLNRYDTFAYYKAVLIPIGMFLAVCFVMLVFIILLRRKVKAAKKELSVKNNRLTMALRAGELTAWRYDVKSKTFYNIDGDTVSDKGLVFSEFIKRIHPDERERFISIISDASKGVLPEKAICFRVDFKSEGNYLFINKEFGIIRSEDGDVESVVGTDKDITETLTVHHKLEDTVKKMQMAIKYSNVVFWEYEYDKKIYHFYSDTVGVYDKASQVTSNEILAQVHPDDKDKMNVFFSDVESGVKDVISANVRIKSGKYSGWRYCNPIATAFTRNSDGKVMLYVGFTCDYTGVYELNKEVKTYADKLKMLMKSADTTLWSYNRNTKLVKVVNGEQEYICPKEEIIGRENETESILDLFEKMERGDSDFPETMMKKKVDGKIKYAKGNIIALNDDDGNIAEYFGAIRDVTGLIEVQNRLEIEKEKALLSDRLKSTFLNNMSHEIRTPLNSIVGFSDLIIDTEDQEMRAEFAKIIKTNTDNLLRLVNDILDLSKFESGTPEIVMEDFNLSDELTECVYGFSNLVDTSSMELIIDSSRCSRMVHFDRKSLDMIIKNFVLNAIKYTAKGHIKVGCIVENDEMKLYCEDTGIGIAKDKQQLVFERFEKLGSLVQGTGLGLSICKAITEYFKGDIGVESELGKGSTFWVKIPINNYTNSISS
jgi:signal transduction histidine kinase/ABC-type amino acid transport substrate-binding protein